MRKQRTRQHQIEDLGFNHIERHVLNAGYTIYRFTHSDYGYDGQINLFNENWEIESEQINLQLKSTDSIQFSEKENGFIFDLSVRDLEFWLYDSRFMLFLLYDAQKELSYFLDLQVYFLEKGIQIKKDAKFVRVFVPIENLFLPQTIHNFRKTKFSK